MNSNSIKVASSGTVIKKRQVKSDFFEIYSFLSIHTMWPPCLVFFVVHKSKCWASYQDCNSFMIYEWGVCGEDPWVTCLVELPSNIHPCLVCQDIHSISAQPVADISFVDRKKDFVDFINHINGDKGNCIDYQIGNVLTIKTTCLCIEYFSY